jgi:hypothetical protein
MTAIRRHLASPAMIVACAALVVALGGVSYATTVLPNNSVGTPQLKKKAVTGTKLKKNAVTGSKVKDASLMAGDFRPGQLPAGPQGPKGDPGPQGPKGDPGATGSPGLSGVEIVEQTETNPYASHDATATCPGGKRALAVAGRTSAPLGKVALTGAKLVTNNAGWVSAQTIDGLGVGGDWSLTASVTCAYIQ